MPKPTPNAPKNAAPKTPRIGGDRTKVDSKQYRDGTGRHALPKKINFSPKPKAGHKGYSVLFSLANDIGKQETHELKVVVEADSLRLDTRNLVSHDRYQQTFTKSELRALGVKTKIRLFVNMITDALEETPNSPNTGLTYHVRFAPIDNKIEGFRQRYSVVSPKNKVYSTPVEGGGMMLLYLEYATRYEEEWWVLPLPPSDTTTVEKFRLQIRDLTAKLERAEDYIEKLHTVVPMITANATLVKMETHLDFLLATGDPGSDNEKEGKKSKKKKGKGNSGKKGDHKQGGPVQDPCAYDPDVENVLMEHHFNNTFAYIQLQAQIFGWKEVLKSWEQVKIKLKMCEDIHLPILEGGSIMLTHIQQMRLRSWLGNWPAVKLLYNSSRDGMVPHKFHELCDNKGPTLTLIKHVPHGQTKDYIFGGFSSSPWTSGNTSDTNLNAFLFSLKNSHGVPVYMPHNTKLVGNPQHNNIHCGPSFAGIILQGETTADTSFELNFQHLSTLCNNWQVPKEFTLKGFLSNTDTAGTVNGPQLVEVYACAWPSSGMNVHGEESDI